MTRQYVELSPNGGCVFTDTILWSVEDNVMVVVIVVVVVQ